MASVRHCVHMLYVHIYSKYNTSEFGVTSGGIGWETG